LLETFDAADLRAHVMRNGPRLLVAVVLTLVACFAVKAALSHEILHDHRYQLARATADSLAGHPTPGFGPNGSPSLERLVEIKDGEWRPDYRPAGWSRLDLLSPPRLDFANLNADTARTLNAVITEAPDPLHAARPFVLRASAAEYMQAVKCLAAAVYYEAATEPLEGQEAVAQVVLNRVRTPGYPKSVCGVVFQGSDKPGCQFTFACDGSMSRVPASWIWKKAEGVAEQALKGFVMSRVGNATHYHATYVLPWWSPSLVKLGRIGQHVFYRRTGPGVFAPYVGGELQITKVNTIGRPHPNLMAPRADAVAASLQLANLTTTVTPDGRVHATLEDPSTITASNVPMLDGKAVLPTVHALISARAAYAKAQMEKRTDADAAGGAPVQMQVREVGTPSHQQAAKPPAAIVQVASAPAP
jgi:spore germination cell wall hydrolase CwlJ-like protein